MQEFYSYWIVFGKQTTLKPHEKIDRSSDALRSSPICFHSYLSAAIAKLASTPASGGASVSFSATAPGRATVTVSPEDEISFSISDAAGRSVMSGKLNNYRGSGATALNTLATWSCTQHDSTDTLSGYGTVLVLKNIDPIGSTTQSWTDGAGRTLRSIDQAGNATVMTYDAGGNQLSVRDANNVGADMVYDALGRNTQRTDTAAAVTKTEYDKSGNAIKQTDAKNKHTFISFDSRNRRKSTTDRINAATNFAYTALGQLASLTDAQNQTTSYTYDSRGSKLTETYPDHSPNTSPGQTGYGKVTFTYDNAGRVLRKQDQLGDTCTYNYDLAGRMTSRNYRTLANSPSGTIADTDTFTFDKAGRMLTAVNGRYTNTVTYAYDPVGRKASESLTISGRTYTIGTEYNSRGEMIKQTYPDGSISDRTYHATGALNQLKLDNATVSTRTYDAGRRLTSDVLGNGITESRTYSNDNLLTAINYSNASIGNLTYTWDTNKNKKSESIGGVMSGYGFTNAGTTYDDEDRLTGYQRTNGALSQSWNLTSVGDWNSVTTSGIGFQPVVQNRTHGPTHELLTAGGQTVNTDVKGNITLLPTALSSLASTALGMSWDFDNKLKSVDVGNNSSTDVEYKYDALGRRVARVGSSGSFVYVQSDQQTIADYGVGDAPSSPLYRYVYASYIDEPVVRKGAGTGGTIHYFHRNQQYSITAVTTSAGAIAERYAYSAYGEPTILDGSGSVLSSSSINNRYSYTGREWDATVGIYHFRARCMSPKSGRFLGRDPIGYEDGASLYRAYFVAIGVDPLGLNCWGLSGTPPFIPGAGGLGGATTSNGQVGFLGWEYTLTLTISGEICKKDCGCGKTVEDMRASVEVTAKGELFATTYGGSYGNQYFQLTYWAGLKVSGGIIGSGSLMFYTDNCNCPGKTLGGGCFEVGGTVSISGGGEGNVRIKLPWWAGAINPVGDARMSLYIQGRVNVTFRRCYECSCHKECVWKDRFCVSGSVTANAQVAVDIGKRIISTSASWTILKGETCTDLN